MEPKEVHQEITITLEIASDLADNLHCRPRDNRLSAVQSWLTSHMLELVGALNRWTEVSRTPRSFPARYFGKGRDIPGLEAELKPLLPEDLEIADIAADLTAFLADCFDAGQFGDLSDLRTTLSKSKPITSFRMADTVLRLCARYAPFALSGPMTSDLTPSQQSPRSPPGIPNDT